MSEKKEGQKKARIIRYTFLALLAVFLGLGMLFRTKYPQVVSALFAPVSVVNDIIDDSELKSTDGRTNILVLGVDRRTTNSHINSVLTDTIMVVSIDEDADDPVLISIPRDLWIEETSSKINEIYALSKNDPESNGDYNVEWVEKAVTKVVGIPIHYYVIVGFDTFTEAIDTVGGLNIYVENTFDDYDYPIEGSEQNTCGIDVSRMTLEEINSTRFPCRYEHLHFDEGNMHMNGETALKFARSRHATQFVERGDFARARRQQKVVVALKDAVLSMKTIFNPTKIAELYKNYKKNVKTNVSLADSLTFYTKYKDVKVSQVEKIVLSDEPKDQTVLGSGLLVAPEPEERKALYDGKYVLRPADYSFDAIHALVRLTLFQ